MHSFRSFVVHVLILSLTWANIDMMIHSNNSGMLHWGQLHRPQIILKNASANDKKPHVDLYTAGWPCQPFSPLLLFQFDQLMTAVDMAVWRLFECAVMGWFIMTWSCIILIITIIMTTIIITHHHPHDHQLSFSRCQWMSTFVVEFNHACQFL